MFNKKLISFRFLDIFFFILLLSLRPRFSCTKARSDIRVKRNLKPIDNALSRVRKLTGYTYDEINLNRRMASIIAQDLQNVLPEGVGEDFEGMLH